MLKQISLKRALLILSSLVLPILIIQAYVYAQPTTPPPGGNISPSFSAGNFAGNVGIGDNISSPTQRLVVGEDTILPEQSIFGESILVGDSVKYPRIALGFNEDRYGHIYWNSAYNFLNLSATSTGLTNNQLVLNSNGNVVVGGEYIGNSTLTVGQDLGNLTNGYGIALGDSAYDAEINIGESATNYGTINWDRLNDALILSNTKNSAVESKIALDEGGFFMGPTMGSQGEGGLINYDNGTGRFNIGTIFGIGGYRTGISIQSSNYDTFTAIGKLATPTDSALTVQETDPTFIARFINTSTTGGGISIQNGPADDSGTNLALTVYDGDGDYVGSISHTGGTLVFNPFTGAHDSKIPEDHNQDGYEYGTIMSLNSAITESGSHQAKYNSQPTTKPYDANIFGVYSSKYDQVDNLHQIYAVGEGHVLITTENGSIKAGDPITSSNLEGLGMKATQAGTILGYALEDWDGSTTTRTETLADGTEVKVGLIAVYYYPGTYYTPDQTEKINSLEQKLNEQESIIKELQQALTKE